MFQGSLLPAEWVKEPSGEGQGAGWRGRFRDVVGRVLGASVFWWGVRW